MNEDDKKILEEMYDRLDTLRKNILDVDELPVGNDAQCFVPRARKIDAMLTRVLNELEELCPMLADLPDVNIKEKI